MRSCRHGDATRFVSRAIVMISARVFASPQLISEKHRAIFAQQILLESVAMNRQNAFPAQDGFCASRRVARRCVLGRDAWRVVVTIYTVRFGHFGQNTHCIHSVLTRYSLYLQILTLLLVALNVLDLVYWAGYQDNPAPPSKYIKHSVNIAAYVSSQGVLCEYVRVSVRVCVCLCVCVCV